ncbi:hypothetical protein PFISCL1PPCAC_9938, partial [Pristionchus fissidentatus]
SDDGPGAPSGSPQAGSPKGGGAPPPDGGGPPPPFPTDGIPPGLPPPPPNLPPPIMVHIRTMMAGSNNEFSLAIAPDCTIGNLKHIIADRLDAAPERQLLSLEGKLLDDDLAVLSQYGVTSSCQILMNLKLSTGTSTKASSDVILFVPNSFPSNNDALRNVIRGMTSRRAPSRARRKEKPADSTAQQWTPQKDMENAMTRNRMKSLIKGRRQRRQSLIDSGVINVSESGSSTPDHGSVIGSAENSVPATPPEWALSSSLSASSISSISTTSLASSSKESVVMEVTEKELKMFFDAPETRGELDATRCDLSVPPSSYEEYQQIKKQKELREKTRCKVCRSKLKLAEQSVVCACARAFCKKHRAPKEHHCPIDYKQTGRDKISKDNPKIYDGGKAKGKLA